MKKKKETTNSNKSAQDKKNKQLEKTEMTPSVEQPEDIELIGEYIDDTELEKTRENQTFGNPEEIGAVVVEYDKEAEERMNKCDEEELAKMKEQNKFYLPTIFLHLIIGLLKNEYFEYPENIATIGEMVNGRNYHQLLLPFSTNGLAEHFVFQELDPLRNFPESRYREEIFIYNDEMEECSDSRNFWKMSDILNKYFWLPPFKETKKFVILFLSKESEIVTAKFLKKYISDFVQDKLSPNGDYYPFAYQDKKMQELILNLHEIYSKTKKIKVSYDMPLLNDKQIRLPEMLLLYSMKGYISIDEVSIYPEDLYFKISILKIPEKKDINNDILKYKGLSFDVKTGKVEYNGKEIKGIFKYRNAEKFYIFEILMRNPGRFISIDELRKTISLTKHIKESKILQGTLKTTIDRLKRAVRMTRPNKQTQLTISLVKDYKNKIAIKLH